MGSGGRKGRARPPKADEPAPEHIGVILRVRPLSQRERKGGCEKSVRRHGEHALEIKSEGAAPMICRCDRAFDDGANQLEFFEGSGLIGLLDAVLRGFRSTAFAYGQTGAGKTYTMVGGGSSFGGGRGRRGGGAFDNFGGGAASGSHDGLLPRSVRHLFARMAEDTEKKFRVRVTCVEVYRESVTDLLTHPSKRKALNVREHPQYGFFVEGLRVAGCATPQRACAVVAQALANRKVGSHQLNERSSRSHALITLYVDAESPPRGGGRAAPTTYGSVTFVDLAGSERLKETKSAGASMVKDAGHINKSLYTLGKVIRGLELMHRSAKAPNVPYRDSALTKLLISSLGGSCKTLMFGCVSSASGSAVNETLRTLDFAARVRGIKNLPKVQVNKHQNLVEQLQEEVARLREENATLREQLNTAPGAYRPTDDSAAAVAARDDDARRRRAPDLAVDVPVPVDPFVDDGLLLPTWGSSAPSRPPRPASAGERRADVELPDFRAHHTFSGAIEDAPIEPAAEAPRESPAKPYRGGRKKAGTALRSISSNAALSPKRKPRAKDPSPKHRGLRRRNRHSQSEGTFARRPRGADDDDDRDKEDELVAMLSGVGADLRHAPRDEQAREDELTAILSRAISFGR